MLEDSDCCASSLQLAAAQQTAAEIIAYKILVFI